MLPALSLWRVHLSIGRRDDPLQFKGYFHGGVISGRAVVSISPHVNVRASAQGERRVAKGSVVKLGGTVGVASVDVVTRTGNN